MLFFKYHLFVILDMYVILTPTEPIPCRFLQTLPYGIASQDDGVLTLVGNTMWISLSGIVQWFGFQHNCVLYMFIGLTLLQLLLWLLYLRHSIEHLLPFLNALHRFRRCIRLLFLDISMIILFIWYVINRHHFLGYNSRLLLEIFALLSAVDNILLYVFYLFITQIRSLLQSSSWSISGRIILWNGYSREWWHYLNCIQLLRAFVHISYINVHVALWDLRGYSSHWFWPLIPIWSDKELLLFKPKLLDFLKQVLFQSILT